MKRLNLSVILAAILFFCLCSIKVLGGGEELETEYGITADEAIKNTTADENEVLFDGFREMDYWMLLESHVGQGISLDYYQYGIYGNLTKTGREGEELYFRLNEGMLGNQEKPADGSLDLDWMKYSVNEHITSFSTDMKWCVTSQYLHETGSDRVEKLYHGSALISETTEMAASNTKIDRFTLCEDWETGQSAVMDENKRMRMEVLISDLWDGKLYLYDRTRFCFNDDGMLAAIVKPDNRHIAIYETEECSEQFEFEFAQMDADWPLEISQFNGNQEEGWLIFSNGGKTYQFFYPENEIIQLGEFMFNTSISPDGKYCSYYTGSDLLYETWEYLYLDNWKKFAEMLERWKTVPSGWYIKELDTGFISYIPIKNYADEDRPLLDGRCVWIQKDKLLQILDL